jgi:predicted nucleic acid-binding protein
MTIEACALFGWPVKGIAARLRKHPKEVQQLTRYSQAIDEVTLLGIDTLPVFNDYISKAADLVRQTGLLFNDALVVAMMHDLRLVCLASSDPDFDRVPGLVRYAPV